MDLQDEIKELKQRISELEKQVKQEQEFPQDGDDYWYVNDDTDVMFTVWYGDEYDKCRLSINNVFKTKDQAEFAVEKLKVEAELRKYGRPFDECYNNYFMKIDSVYNTIVVYDEECHQTQGVIYFESEKKADEAIESVGEERIKKYIFGTEGVATSWIHGYEVEKEPLYYAKIKGWELTNGESVFWNRRLVITEDNMLPRLYTSGKEDGFFVVNKMTIEEWNERGINETNADFEEVE